MAATLYPDFPPKLSPKGEEYLLHNLKDWSLANGLVVRPVPALAPQEGKNPDILASVAPVTIFPSPFPRSCFEEAQAIQWTYNKLYAAIAEDEEWLGEIIEELLEVDDFIAKIWELHLAVKKEGYTHCHTLGIFRSDYMIHLDPTDARASPEIRQVEFNTIASSFGGLASQVSLLHRHLERQLLYADHLLIKSSALPTNTSIPSISRGLILAHLRYGSSKSSEASRTCVLFIVQSPERNAFDQRLIEYELTKAGILVFRLSLDQILEHASLTTSHASRPLLFQPSHSSASVEVSTVYYRAGYSPDEYGSERVWKGRLLIERSAAIKCPSVLTHLAGSKKVQQVLATPSSPHLSRFIPSVRESKRLEETFAAIYPLDDSTAGKEAKKIALDPEKCKGYVLKPQREGGGNNIYRSAIPDFLKKLGDERHWRGYILMELIEPPALKNSILRDGVVKSGEVIGELGIYGVCLWETRSKDDSAPGEKTRGEIIENYEAGYLLRTKGRESEEGGVAAGFGSVDSVCLVDV